MSLLSHKIINLMSLLSHKILKFLRIKRKHIINDFCVYLDYDHKLPMYTNRFLYYDKFLPHLVKYLKNNSTVVDVGANIGDTLVSMITSNPQLNYICIEGDDEFFNELQYNTERLKSIYNDAIIINYNVLVGEEIKQGKLEGTGGTKNLIQTDIESNNTHRLDNIVDESYDVSLIKTDIDGFDWDAIKSADQLLKQNPLIYFECQYSSIESLNHYNLLINYLLKNSYKYFAFFDNYGNYILNTSNINIINNLLEYCLYNNNDSIFYYDILAYSNRHEFVEDSLYTYRRKIQDK